jgi:redox-sensitive bicupin YhaK (pirin superfamily)
MGGISKEPNMIQLRKSLDRGHADHGWLKSYHTFSFADYYDPEQMGFAALRVINEDWVKPDTGFGMHAHRDMEIVTYVLEGALQHKDSMGNGSVLRPGELQRMSAGTGIRHSEFNPSTTEAVHLYQIWLLPRGNGITPSYEQKYFADEEKHSNLRLVASPDGADGSLTIYQDAKIYLSTLNTDTTVHHDLANGRHAWLQVLRGRIAVNGQAASAGDGLAVSAEPRLDIVGKDRAEIMLFDMP